MCKYFRCGNLVPYGRKKDKIYRCRITKSACNPYLKSIIGFEKEFDITLCNIVNHSQNLCAFCRFRLGCLYDVK